MAVLIPALGSCTFATGGERRFAERLEAKLDGDYLCWYDVALGPAALHPDFIVFHPRRGVLVLEIKDWRRTTILKINYRNTDAILRFARDVAQGILEPADADEDGVPLLAPQSAGRGGDEPQIINLPTPKAEAEFVVERLKAAHRAGTPWRDMAVIYREYERDAKLIRRLLPAHGIPLVYFRDATHASDEDKVTLITMHSCKGLEFPLVVIPGADKIQRAEALTPQETRLLYVAMTRATRELVLCGVGEAD